MSEIPARPVQDLDSVELIGAGLRRPECVLCTADGVTHVSNWDGGISRKLRNISSMAFAGADLRDAYLGCLLGQSIARIRLPLAGHPPAHWDF